MSERNGGQIRRLVDQRYWQAADARVVVVAWEKSGKTIRAFAQAHGLHPERLARWTRQLKTRPAETIKLHRVRVVNSGERRAMGGGAERIEVELSGGQVVRVPTGCRAEDLRVVMAVLEERTAC